MDVFWLLPWKLLPAAVAVKSRHLRKLLSVVEDLLILWAAALPFDSLAMMTSISPPARLSITLKSLHTPFACVTALYSLDFVVNFVFVDSNVSEVSHLSIYQ